jgi:hypothetical protein
MMMENESLENPMISSKQDPSRDSKLFEENKCNFIVKSSAAMSLKLVILLLVRFAFMVFNNYNEDAVLVSSYYSNVVLVIVYLITLIVIHLNFEHLNRSISKFFTVWIGVIELLIVLNTSFSNLLIFSFVCLIAFYTFIIIFVSKTAVYSLKASLITASIIFAVGATGLYLTSFTYVSSLFLGYIKMNTFIGAFFYSLWSCVYFSDGLSFGETDPLWMSFIFVLDGFMVIRKILEQVSEEFKSHNEIEEDLNQVDQRESNE